MSVDLFLQFFEHGESVSAPIRLLEEAFSKYRDNDNDDLGYWRLRFPDDGFTELFISDEKQNTGVVSGFMIARPPAFSGFWEDLFDLMRQTPAVLFFKGAIAVNEAAIAGFHPGFVKGLGPIKVAKTPADLLQVIP